MLCFTLFSLMTANMMLPLHPHKVRKLLNCCRTDNFFFGSQYYLGICRWLCGEIQIYKCIIFTVNVGTRVVIIGRVVEKPGHVRKVVDGLIDTEKRSTFNTIVTVQVPVSKRFYTRMALHTATQNTDVSLALVKCITKTWYYR